MGHDGTARTLAGLANDLLGSCDEGQRKLLRGSLDDSDLRQWT